MKIWKQNYFSKGHSTCKKYWQKNALGSLETLVLKPTALHSWHDYSIFLNCMDEMSWDCFAKELELGSADLLLILSVLLTMHSLFTHSLFIFLLQLNGKKSGYLAHRVQKVVSLGTCFKTLRFSWLFFTTGVTS